MKKHLLRQAMHGTLPEAVYLRPKTALAGDPAGELLRDGHGQFVDSFVATGKLATYVERNAVPHVAGEKDTDKLWMNIRPFSLNCWLKDQEHLWPESVTALFGDALPRLTPTWDKRYLDLTGNGYRFQDRPLPLAAVYILGERGTDLAAPFVEAVPAGTGLINLVANSYTPFLMDKAMRAREFTFLGRVKDSVRLRRVHPPENSADLPKVCKVILDDFHSLSASATASTDSTR